MTANLAAYLPQDRRRALACGESLPDRTAGTALFADISGFTTLTENLGRQLGRRRGIETLTSQINAVYTALIAEVERYDGSVIGFAGDAVMCWFDEKDEGRTTKDERPHTAARAVASALAMQTAMSHFPELGLKIAIATGPARRFVVGDPQIHYLDTLAGATVSRTAAGEHLANKGEVLVDEATVKLLGTALTISEWRADSATGESFAVITHLAGAVALPPLPEVPALDSTQLQAWLHQPLYEREAVGQGSFLTEFRPCVALFVRFVGIDYDSDEATAQLDAFIRQLQQIGARYDGALLQLTIGDKGSYAYINFGALQAHEDDGRRAVKAALALREVTPLVLHMGVAQGVMRVGAYGGATRRTYGALGDDVNLAARLMSQAAPDEVLVSKRIQSATAADFAFVAHPAVQFKGKVEPVPIFAVVGQQKRRAIRLQEPAYALPMVGRQAELETLTARMDLALQGNAQVIGIVAEAGLGKSRLVAEVVRAARQKGFTGYGGACQSDAISTPYHAWKSIWQAFFDVDPEMPLRKLMRNLEGEIADRAPLRVDAIPLLNVLLGSNIPENNFTKTLEPKIRQSALHALLEDCLKAAAQDEPLLIVIEDMHWMDALSHDLLAQLAKALTWLPVCFVLAYRPPQLARLAAPRLESLPQFTRIELQALTPGEAEQAIRAKLAQLYPLRDSALSAGLVETLMARSQGNPFYLEELLNYVHDRGLDPADLDQIELPDSLHTLILSRIDRLSEREKSTLRVASIIGRLFRADWLIGYYPELGAFPQVKESLEQLHTLDITPLESPEPDLAYLFKHIVTHEVTYESLPFATRARLHEQLAAYLENAYPDTLPLETLAFHYGRSDNRPKQIEYLRRAGEAAQKNFAGDAALDFYGKLLSLLANNLLGNDQDKFTIHLQRGQVLELMGQWAEAESDYRAALALAHDNAEKAGAQFALGKLNRLAGEYETALNWLAQAREIQLTSNDGAGLAETLIEMGTVLWRQGAYAEARERLNEGRAQAQETGDTVSMALALNNLGIVAVDQSDYAAARALYEESLNRRREMGDKRGVAASLNNLGVVAWYQGDYAAARTLYEESLSLQREMGDKWGVALSLNNLGLVAWYQSDYAAARALHEESLSLAREMGDKWGVAASLNGLGIVAADQGDYAAARALYEESLSLAREMGDKWGVALSLNGLGIVAKDQGDYAAARALYEESLSLAREMGDKRGVAASLHNLGSVAADQGDYAAARALYEESLSLRREMGDKQGVAASLNGLGIVAWYQSDYAAARALYEESLSLGREMGDKRVIAGSLNGLGYLNLLQGDANSAHALFVESLTLSQEMELKVGIVANLIGLAAVSGAMGNNGRAAHLAAAAETLRVQVGFVLPPLQRGAYEKVVATTRVALGEEAFAAAWSEGERWSLEEAVAYALEEMADHA